MAHAPNVPHKRVKEPNTQLQRKIIEAVEEKYPGKDLKEIASDVGCHPSSVSRTVKDFMAPINRDVPDEDSSDEMDLGFESDLDLDIPDSVQPDQYVAGYSDGFEAGFQAALEWVERQSDSNPSNELSTLIAQHD